MADDEEPADIVHTRFYELLEVEVDASQDEIKTAYHRLSRKYHPDKRTGGVNKENLDDFKEISRAYKFLSDPEMRDIYDEDGEEGLPDPDDDDEDLRLKLLDVGAQLTKEMKEKAKLAEELNTLKTKPVGTVAQLRRDLTKQKSEVESLLRQLQSANQIITDLGNQASETAHLHQEQLEKVRLQAVALDEQLQKAHSESTDLSTELVRLRQQNAALVETIGKRDQSVADGQYELIAANQTIAELRRQTAELVRFREEMTKSSALTAELEAKLEKARLQSVGLTEKMNITVEEFRKRLHQAHSESVDLRTELMGLRQQNAALVETVEQRDQIMADGHSELQIANQTINELCHQTADLVRLREEMIKSSALKAELEAKILEGEKTVGRLNIDLASAIAEIANVRTQADNHLHEAMKKAERELNECRDRLRRSDTYVDNLTGELVTVRQHNKALSDTVDNCERSMAKLQTALTAANVTNGELRAQLTNQELRNGYAKADYLNEEVAGLKAFLSEQEAVIEDLRKEVSLLRRADDAQSGAGDDPVDFTMELQEASRSPENNLFANAERWESIAKPEQKTGGAQPRTLCRVSKSDSKSHKRKSSATVTNPAKRRSVRIWSTVQICGIAGCQVRKLTEGELIGHRIAFHPTSKVTRGSMEKEKREEGTANALVRVKLKQNENKCDFVGVSMKQLLDHRQIEHQNNGESVKRRSGSLVRQGNTIFCSQLDCLFQCSKAEQLEKHRLKSHEPEKSPDKTPVVSPSVRGRGRPRTRYCIETGCELNKTPFTTVADLEKHRQDHHQLLNCDVCKQKFNGAIQLAGHMENCKAPAKKTARPVKVG